MSGPCCNEAQALTLCCFVFLAAWNIDSLRLIRHTFPSATHPPHTASASLLNRFCSFRSDCKLWPCPEVHFFPLFCVLPCPANLILSLWEKDSRRNVGDEVGINKGHTFYYCSKRIKPPQVDVFLVVNQITRFAESRKTGQLELVVPIVSREYFSSHYNSIHGPHGDLLCGYLTDRLDLNGMECYQNLIVPPCSFGARFMAQREKNFSIGCPE